LGQLKQRVEQLGYQVQLLPIIAPPLPS